MQKITREQASEVLMEAYKLKSTQAKSYGDNHARLGQSIHWVTTMGDISNELKLTLQQMLDYHHATAYDFFYQKDDEKVIEMFFNNYVELGE